MNEHIKEEGVTEDMSSLVKLAIILILIAVYLLTFLLAPTYFVSFEVVISLGVYFVKNRKKLVDLAKFVWSCILYLLKWHNRKLETEFIKNEINKFIEQLNFYGSGMRYQISRVICSPRLKEEGAYVDQDFLVVIKVKCDGNVHRTIVKITLFFFQLWVVPDPSVLSHGCFQSLSYMMAEDFFLTLDRPDLLNYLLRNFTDPFIKQSPDKGKCMVMLRKLRKHRLFRCALLIELRTVSSEYEAKKILIDIYNKVVCKRQGVDTDPTIDGRCTFLMVGKPENIMHLYSYVRWAKIAIKERKVHRIYLLATGHVNVAVTEIIGQILEEECNLKKIMEDSYQHTDTKAPGTVVAYTCTR